MFHNKRKTPKDGSEGDGHSSLTSTLTSLSAKEREDALKILGALSVTERGVASKAGPGRFYDPKTDKTYKQKKPVRRSDLYSQTENLEKQAIANLRDFVKFHELVYDPKTKATTASEGKVLTKELQLELESLKGALANAKVQHKLVRDTEAKGRAPKKKDGPALDPNKKPVLVEKDGKLSWADIVEQGSQ